MTLIVIIHQKAGEQKDRRVDDKNELSWIVKSKAIEMTLYLEANRKNLLYTNMGGMNDE
jgi:hypothetical protein